MRVENSGDGEDSGRKRPPYYGRGFSATMLFASFNILPLLLPCCSTMCIYINVKEKLET
jgi:hypothetical protein